MVVMVTGGAGYIGSHIVWALVDAGEDVIVVDRLSTGFASSIPTHVPLYKEDIGNRKSLDAIFRDNAIGSIIHLAGSVIVPESVTNPLLYYDNNTSNSRTLIECAIANGVSNFVFSSTAAVYGTPKSKIPVTEDSDLNPESPYGSSKLMTEIMLRDVSNAYDKFVYTALRYFNVAGCDLKSRTGQSTIGATHLLKVACETAVGKRPKMAVYGNDYPTSDGTCVRDYIHVADLADAHLKALARMRNGGDSIVANCGYGSGFSVLEVINCVKEISGVDFKVELSPRRKGDAAAVIANSDLAKRELNWIPKYNDLSTIVRTALNWEIIQSV